MFSMGCVRRRRRRRSRRRRRAGWKITLGFFFCSSISAVAFNHLGVFCRQFSFLYYSWRHVLEFHSTKFKHYSIFLKSFFFSTGAEGWLVVVGSCYKRAVTMEVTPWMPAISSAVYTCVCMCMYIRVYVYKKSRMQERYEVMNLWRPVVSRCSAI